MASIGPEPLARTVEIGGGGLGINEPATLGQQLFLLLQLSSAAMVGMGQLLEQMDGLDGRCLFLAPLA